MNDGPVGTIAYYVFLAIYEASGNEPTSTVHLTVLQDHASALGCEHVLGISSPISFRRESVRRETCIMNPTDKAAKKNACGAKKRWTPQFVKGALPSSGFEVSRTLAPDFRATPDRSKIILKSQPIDDVCGGVCVVAPKVAVYDDFAPTAGCICFVIGDRLTASAKQKCQKILQ